MDTMPKWADIVLIPLINLLIAFFLSGLVIWGIGKDPFEAIRTMVTGAFGSSDGFGYTLYYATNFIFTGLAVAIASHARLFNIGGEGQVMLGGLGLTLLLLSVDFPHWAIALPVAVIVSAAFGAGWAFVPAYLAAKRDSHIVVTTIMFNLIAFSLLGYMLASSWIKKTGGVPESNDFAEAVHLPNFHEILAPLGIEFSKHAPANISFFIAVMCCGLLFVILWHTRLGSAIRSYGKSEGAAIYAGISPVKITIIAMMMSGGLAGLMAVNATMGEAERLILGFSEGAGFIGIAVALMGRNHPFGIFLAAMLFGFLYQGGSELSLWMGIPRELVIVIQALVILLTGALDNMVRMPVERAFLHFRKGAN